MLRHHLWVFACACLSVVSFEAAASYSVTLNNVGTCLMWFKIEHQASPGSCTFSGSTVQGEDFIEAGTSKTVSGISDSYHIIVRSTAGVVISGAICHNISSAGQSFNVWVVGCFTEEYFISPRIINLGADDVEIGIKVGTEDLDTLIFAPGSSTTLPLGPYPARSNVTAYSREVGLSYNPANGQVTQVTVDRTIQSVGPNTPPWQLSQGAANSTPWMVVIGSAPRTDTNPSGTNSLAPTGTNSLTGPGSVNPTNGAPTGGGGGPTIASEALALGGVIDAINAHKIQAHDDSLKNLQQLQGANTNLLKVVDKLVGATNLLSGVTNLLSSGTNLLSQGTNILTGISNRLAFLTDTNGFATNTFPAMTNRIGSFLAELGSIKDSLLSKFVHWDLNIGSSPFGEVGMGPLMPSVSTDPFEIPIVQAGSDAAKTLIAFFLVLAFWFWACSFVFEEVAKSLRVTNYHSSSGGAIPMVGAFLSSTIGIATIAIAMVALVTLLGCVFSLEDLNVLLVGPGLGGYVGQAFWVANHFFPLHIAIDIIFCSLVMVITGGFWKLVISFICKTVSP